MQVGEVNRSMVIVLVVALLGVGGWLWYSMVYKPAVEQLDISRSSNDAAQAKLSAVEQELAMVQEQKREKGLDKSAIAKLAVGHKAIPRKPQRPEAIIMINRVAKATGVQVDTIEFEDGGASNPGDTSKVLPQDIIVKASGTFGELMLFTERLQELVDVNRGQVYVTGLLLAITSVEIGVQLDGGEDQELPKGHLPFTFKLKMFAEAESTTPASPNPADQDPANAPSTSTPVTGQPGGAAAPTGDAQAGTGTPPPASTSTEPVPSGAG